MFPLLPQKISLQIKQDQGALVRQKHLIQTSCMMCPSQWRAMLQRLLQLMRERILVLDGAYGSAFQNYSLSEDAFRGESYANHGHPLQGNHDILNLTQPQIVAEVHDGYLEAGCDIISTNTFNATSIAQEDFGTQDICFDLNHNPIKSSRCSKR